MKGGGEVGSVRTKLIVANTGSDSLSLIDLESESILSEIELGRSRVGPHSLVVKDSSCIYSVNSYDNSISIVNILTGLVEQRTQVGRFPTHMQIINEHIYVVNSDSNSVTVLDKESLGVIGNISVGEKPHDIIFDKKTNKILITNHSGYSIYSIDLEKNIEEEILLESSPFHFKVIRDTVFIILHPSSQSKFSKLQTIDFESKSTKHVLDISGTIVDIVDIGETIYITNAEDGFLYEVDYVRAKIIKKHRVGKMPNNIVCSGEKIYITDTGDDSILVFSHKDKKILSKIKVGLEPSGLNLIE